MVSERYIRGFATRCAEFGVDPAQLLKTAGILSDSLMENIANAKLLSDITNEQLKSDMKTSPQDDDDYETVSFKRRRKRKPEVSVVFDKSMSGADKADTDMLLAIARRVEERRRRK